MQENYNRKPYLTPDFKSLALHFRESRVFLTAIDLGVFEAIGDQAVTAKDIAATIGANIRALEILLDALAGLSLLEKHAATYRNSAAVIQLLARDPSDSALSFFRHQSNSWRSWSALTQTVKDGSPPKEPQSRQDSIDLAMAMRVGSKEAVDRLGLMLDFSNIHTLCDMGCGPGAVSMGLLQRHSHLSAVLIDASEEAIGVARQDAARRDLSHRIHFVPRNLLQVDLSEQFDLIFLSLVLCLFEHAQAVTLLKKARAALNPGGLLVIGEVLLHNNRITPATAALFAVHLLVGGSGGALFSLESLCDVLHESGFRYQRSFPTTLYHVVIGTNALG